MHAPGGSLLVLFVFAQLLPSVEAQDGVAVLSTAVVLALLGLCVGICCCAGIGMYTICAGKTIDYDRQKDPDLPR